MTQALSNPVAVHAQAKVSSVDRFGFTLFVAIAVHALVILGVAFDAEDPVPVATTLEVTLARFTSAQAPEKADFIAQDNQLGSGDSHAKTLPSSREVAPFQNNQATAVAPGIVPSQQAVIQPPQPPQPALAEEPAEVAALQPPLSEQPEQLKTQGDSDWKLFKRARQQPAAVVPPAFGLSSSLLSRSLEIASLEARLDDLRQQQANAPRVRRLTSASTRASFDAEYLDSWRRKVERVGNINYPEQARRKELHGNLRLLVVLRPDGSLERVAVLKSSGHPVLDNAAKRIVRLAAPYAPFPVELRKRADRVEIIRTWKFERTQLGVNG
ncbi:MAG: protein TonB [Motiliproteus sp.]|jgi:protein TonB